MGKNNYFYQATESFLFSYGQVESYIDDLNEKIEEANEGGWADIKAIQYDKLSVKTSGISRSTENAVIAKLQFIEDVKKELYYNVRFKKRMDKALKNLDKQEFKVVKLRYFKNNSNEKCMELLKYKKSKFYQIKDRAIKKISISLYGVKAIKQEILKLVGDSND